MEEVQRIFPEVALLASGPGAFSTSAALGGHDIFGAPCTEGVAKSAITAAVAITPMGSSVFIDEREACLGALGAEGSFRRPRVIYVRENLT